MGIRLHLPKSGTGHMLPTTKHLRPAFVNGDTSKSGTLTQLHGAAQIVGQADMLEHVDEL